MLSTLVTVMKAAAALDDSGFEVDEQLEAMVASAQAGLLPT